MSSAHTSSPNAGIVTTLRKNDVVLSRRTSKLFRYSRGGFRLVCNDGFIRFHSKLQEFRPNYANGTDLVKMELAKSIFNYIVNSEATGRFLMPIHSPERAMELGLPLDSRKTAFLLVDDPLEKIHHLLRVTPRRYRNKKMDFQNMALDRMRTRMSEFLETSDNSNRRNNLAERWSMAFEFCLETSDMVGPTVVFELLTSPSVLEVIAVPSKTTTTEGDSEA